MNRHVLRRVLGGSTVLALLASAGWFYQDQREDRQQEIRTRLTTIAKLKADQIANWRRERVEEAIELTERHALAARIRHWLTQPDAAPPDELLAELELLLRHRGYAAVLLVMPDGQVRVSVGGVAPVDKHVSDALAAALQDGRPRLTELHVDSLGSTPHIAAVAPILTSQDPGITLLATLVLVIDPERFLYRLIEMWPAASATAETLLVRPDGDSVLYLNPLRHRGDPALTLRLSASDLDLLGAGALRGTTGFVEGLDYRRVPVVAAVLPVPGSRWVVVTKMDAAEAFSLWRADAVLLLVLVFVAIALFGVAEHVLWERDQKGHYRRLYRLEAAQRADEERYRIVLNSIGEAVITTDSRGRVQSLNPVAEALTGWPAADAHGRPLHDVFRILDEEKRRPVENAVERVLREGAVVGLTNHTILVARDGTERAIAESGAPLRDEHAIITGVVLVFRDHTQERIAQRGQRFAEALVNSTQEPIYALDPSCDFRLVFANDAACRHFGYPREQLLAMSPADWDPDFSLPRLREEWLSRSATAPVMMETLNRVADGRLVPVEVFVSVLEYEGRVLSVGSIRDITERKQAEEQQRLQAAALNAAANAIVITDRDGTIRWVNPAWIALTGYTAEAAVGNTPRILKSGVQDESFYRSMWTTILAGRVWRAELINRRCDGSEYVEEETITPLHDEHGQVSHFIGIKQDITARRRSEAEREKLQGRLQQVHKMESLGRLAGGVAHDFNNMLSVILGHAELALDQLGPSDGLRDDLQQIQHAALRSAELTRQLLGFSRQQTVSPQVLDLNDTVAGMLKMLRRLMGEDLDLAWMPGSGVWPVKIDPTQVSQILANLCVNARDAIDGVGRVTIRTGNATFDPAFCDAHEGARPGPHAMLAISDTGRGMTPDVLAHLFEPFFTTKDLGQGTGLGLATVYGIVKQNEGFISVSSTPGAGSAFQIHLPKASDEARAGDAPVGVRPGHGETLLLVEDEAALLQLGGTILQRLGYTVLAAATPGEAIHLAETHPATIDLLITDVVMPDMNGRELVKRLQSLRPGLRYLFMSGYTADVIAHRGILDEGVQFLQKPFSKRQLAAKVRTVLGADSFSPHP